jgi:hypothetical protein
MEEGNFVSEPASGYSVDNLFPTVPQGVAGSIGEDHIQLSWEPNPDPDLNYYSIYRSEDDGDFLELTQSTEPYYTDSEIKEDVGYKYAVSATDFSGNESDLSDDVSIIISGIENGSMPKNFSLDQNYPNPFNPSTIINYELQITNDVELSIYNSIGQKVATLVSERQSAGTYQVEWDASGFPSGVYYYRLSTDAGFVKTRKLVLLK